MPARSLQTGPIPGFLITLIMTRIARGHQKRNIPFSSKDPRYQKIYSLMMKGKTLEEALAILKNPIPSSQKDPDGIGGMILDTLSLIHGDLLRIERLLSEMEAH